MCKQFQPRIESTLSIRTKRTAGLCPAPHQGREVRNLKGRNSPSWGDCSLSADLSTNEISATGGHSCFVPWTRNRGKSQKRRNSNAPLLLGEDGQTCRRYASGPAAKAASPDALHPGKVGRKPQGKASFPLGFFPGFLWARSLLTLVALGAASEGCFFFPPMLFR